MQQKTKTNNENTAIWVVIIGALITILIPALLPFFPLNFLKEYGGVGDAFGGIANPFAQIVGFVLLYLALKAQIDANQVFSEKIKSENKKEMQQRELEQLHELYLFFESNIKDFSYENRFESNGSIQILYGRRAIRCFINDIEKNNIDLHNTEELLQEDGVREILSILKTAKLLLERIQNADIEKEDQVFYMNIMKHELVFSIFPYTDLDESSHLKLPMCPQCHEHHGNYPPLILHKLESLKQYFV